MPPPVPDAPLTITEPEKHSSTSYSFQVENRLINRRQIWAANRFWMEMYNLKTKRYGNRGSHSWYTLLLMMKTFKLFLQMTGLYQQGVRNALDIQLLEHTFSFDDLPAAFDGFTILHLSDLHLDAIPNLPAAIHSRLGGRSVDLCVLTGDYRTKLHGLKKHIIEQMQELISGIDSRNGFIGVLGNHDDCHMVDPLEKIGIRMLINSTCLLERQDQKIQLIGTDDVHYYYTDQALHVLEPAEREFSIGLIHSPELFDMAALMGVRLYLCGHTHGGQVCLPGGLPVIKHLNRGRRFYRGRWQHLEMQGYTNSGVSTSGIPVRFNTQGEIAIHTLRASQ